jgi:ectoine hydroxylase-related dioxygenase (phytanoyl-CoA dioxygenase family)
LKTILCGKKDEVALYTIGPFDLHEEGIRALNPDSTIIDVGCANGDNLDIMRQIGFSYLSGIDISPGMVETARKRTELPIHCADLFEYDGPGADVIFAQALVHLFPKKDLSKVLQRLLSLAKQRFYFSTTLHDTPTEGLEPKMHVVRYRSRYTENELLAYVQEALTFLNSQEKTWHVFYFHLTDHLGKNWINVVFDKIDLSASYEKNGVIVYRDFLDKEYTTQIAEELAYFASNKAPKGDWLRYDDGDVFDRVEDFVRFLNPELRDYLYSPTILNTIHKCFGKKVTLLKDKCNFKPSGKEAFPLHQDALAGWEKSGYGKKHITLAISLDTISLDNAPLQFVTGKHHEGLFSDLYEVIDHDYYKKWNFQPDTMSPGDAIIFDSYTPHFSAANTSDKQRRIVFLTYVDSQYEEAAAQFFSEKRRRQPPIDERDSSMKLVRNEYGKWVYG